MSDSNVQIEEVYKRVKKERLNLHRSVPTVSILNHLTGWSVQEIIPIILILLLKSRTRYFPAMQ